jgi:hypothetical protein
MTHQEGNKLIAEFMFEIGDIVRFRNWSNQPWIPDEWIVIDFELTHQHYDDVFYSYTIRNLRTDEVETEVSWQQIELK